MLTWNELIYSSVSERLLFSLWIQGTVIIIANHGDRIDIPAGAVLENKIVSGNLRILDHWANGMARPVLQTAVLTNLIMEEHFKH